MPEDMGSRPGRFGANQGALCGDNWVFLSGSGSCRGEGIPRKRKRQGL